MDIDFGTSGATANELGYLLEQLGVADDQDGTSVLVRGDAPRLDTPVRVIDAGVLTLAAEAYALASLTRSRTGQPEHIVIDQPTVIHSLKPFVHTLLDGEPASSWGVMTSTAPCNGYFRTADDRIVYMVNLIPRLRKVTLNFFGLPSDATRADVEAAIATWNAQELEDAMAEARVPVAVMRSPDEWSRMPQAQALAARPLIDIRSVGSASPRPLPHGDRPFSGIKVLDMTHVVAGPTITRGLAEYGADVLHVKPSDPDLADAIAIQNEFGLGKRPGIIDMKTPEGKAKFVELIRGADIFVHSWRPGVFDRLGFSAERIAELSPGIIQISVSCYGPTGPWAERGGFDGLALASTGATSLEPFPRLTPPGVLTDSLVGFLGTAVAASLLERRAREGGSYRAELSLTRTAMWALGLGEVGNSDKTTSTIADPVRWRITAPIGVVDYVAPTITFSHTVSELREVGAESDLGWP